jgi:cytidine deaminase
VIGAEAATELTAEIESIAARPGGASTIPAGIAAELVARHGLDSTSELALLALTAAGTLARPSISGYRVAAVGIEAETGDLLLGGNLEFPGSELTTTIHAEGFVALRARNRGRMLAILAVREAHPCAHCRQTLSESAAADGLAVIDLDGNRLALGDLYPWPFRPAALGVAGDEPGLQSWPGLSFVAQEPPTEIARPLLEAGAHAHAPYSGAPSAVVLRTSDGGLRAAACVESVAFNPSISALQAALVEVVAARQDPVGISEGWLGLTEGGPVDPEPGFRALLRAVAPDASAHVARWRLGQG